MRWRPPLVNAMDRKDMPFEVRYGRLGLNAQAIVTSLARLGCRVTQGTAFITSLTQQRQHPLRQRVRDLYIVHHSPGQGPGACDVCQVVSPTPSGNPSRGEG